MNFKQHLEKLNTQGGHWNMITVDGVVGVGKSTLMNILVKERGLIPFEEPVVDNPILDWFYTDRERWSLTLQIFFFLKRSKDVRKASLIQNAILDRSIYGDLIFAKMLFDKGDMKKEEYELYIEFFEDSIQLCKPPKLMIYLESSVDEAMRKINKRGRDYEQVVERAYWEDLNSYYQEYFNQYESSPVLRINVDHLDFENNPEHQKYVLNLVDEKLSEIDQL